MTMLRLLVPLPLVLGLAGPSWSQGVTCSNHAALHEQLAERWGESRQSMGLASDGAVLEFYASDETGTWTIAVTRPGGPTCIVATGEHYEALTEALPPPGEGA